MNNFDSLRGAILASSGARNEEKIEVNQRHLIDKILARYSAEYTIYREVLQNANDAGAKMVEIVFESDAASREGDTCDRISSVCLRNNGRPFNADDWGRLKKIAEGNPDEQKEPLVVSGEDCLAFYWNGDQLYARPSKTPESMNQQKEKWTSIYLKLREPIQKPHMDSFAHFMAKSLLFTINLSTICIIVDDKMMFSIEKKSSPPSDLPLSPSGVLKSLKSLPGNIFKINTTTMQAVQLTLNKRYTSIPVKRESSIFSNLWLMAKNLAKDKESLELEASAKGEGTFSIFLHIVNVTLDVSTSSSFAQSMDRITKKKPAKKASLSMIYSSFDEIKASATMTPKVKHPVLDNVLPTKGNGKVFIGFETHQTTGCALHVAGPFIPTVERESLDFVDTVLSQWNQELFSITGRISRILYEIEMISLKRLYPEKTEELPLEYWERASHILSSFGVEPSSPSPIPSFLLGQEFVSCTDKAPLVPSSVGVVSASDLRYLAAPIMTFTQGIPALNAAKLTDSEAFLRMISGVLNIPTVTVVEVMNSIQGKQLTDLQLLSCMEWLVSVARNGQLSSKAFYAVVSNLMVPTGMSTDRTYRILSQVSHFPSGSLRYESLLPLPDSCLSPRISERVTEYDLREVFNLRPFTVVDWTYFLVTCGALPKDLMLAERSLAFLSQCFANKMSEEEKAALASILHDHAVIPTRNGLRRPPETYLEKVKMLGEASTVSFINRSSISDDFLVAIGVQTHLDVTQIFARLDKLEWDHRNVVKYLASVRDQLSEQELNHLAQAKIFPAIGETPDRFYRLNELYVESDIVKLLSLPMLLWRDGHGPNMRSDSTRLMIDVGLQVHPHVDALLQKVSSSDVSTRVKLLKYFVENYESHYKNHYNAYKITYAFLPCRDGALYGARECFSDEGVSLLKFPVLIGELAPFASYFGVSRYPPSPAMVKRIIARDWDAVSAPKLLNFLSSILGEFTRQDLDELGNAEVLPHRKSPSELTWLRPKDVFFSLGRFELGNLFTVVDFGEGSRPFLQACGVQSEPRPTQVANRLAHDAPTLLKALTPTGYLDLLRWLALQLNSIGKEDSRVIKAMKEMPCLLGVNITFEETPTPGDKNEEAIVKYILAKGQDLFIIDDAISQQHFKCHSVPADSTLENMYHFLGSPYLSHCIKKTWKVSGTPKASQMAVDLQDLIHKRAKLLVAEQQLSETKIKKDALKQLQCLSVFEVSTIGIHRKFRDQEHFQPSTACIDGSSAKLLITSNYDFFDVGNALCQVLYADSSRLPDSLLISTLLSCSLSSLRAKGFPVDRILGLHEARPTNSSIGDIPVLNPATKAPDESPESVKAQRSTPVKAAESEKIQRKPSLESTMPKTQIRQEDPSNDPVKLIAGFLGNFKQKIRERFPSSAPPQGSTADQPMGPTGPIGSSVSKAITSQDIKSSLQQSIRNLKSHDRTRIQDSDRVMEPPSAIQAQSSSYCEVIPGSSLNYCGSLNNLQIYLAKSISNSDAFIHDRQALFHNFCTLITFVGSIFSIDASLLHVFYDADSRAIAFNRGGSLFFNAAYYERQRTASNSVNKGQMFGSWYMTFCHELAHNFIRQHDEHHEYYMSSFAECYLEDLMERLQL